MRACVRAWVHVFTSAVSPSDGEVDSKKPVNLPRTNGARGFWLPVYYAHSNDVLLLRKDDTPGHSLTRHSPTPALSSALGSVSFYSTLLLSPTANIKRTEETSYADEVKRWHFRLLFGRWPFPISAGESAIADTIRLHILCPQAAWHIVMPDLLTITNHQHIIQNMHSVVHHLWLRSTPACFGIEVPSSGSH